MKKWEKIAEITTGAGHVMTLASRDGVTAIRVNGRELMSSRHHASEEKLATVACTPWHQTKDARVLIGGLGLGFTLRQALKVLGPSATVEVAELIPEVVAWNKDPALGLAHAELADPRTIIREGDVHDIISSGHGQWNAVMLDADNGTTAMNSPGNQRLYEDSGILAVMGALKPGGVAVWWSAQAEPIFAKKLGRAGFDVTVETVRGHASGSGPRHTLLIARLRS